MIENAVYISALIVDEAVNFMDMSENSQMYSTLVVADAGFSLIKIALIWVIYANVYFFFSSGM